MPAKSSAFPVSASPQGGGSRENPAFLAEVRRHQRHNIAVFFGECLTSGFHWGFFETPVFAAYLLALGASPLMVTAATSTYLFAWNVPMVLFVPLIQRRGDRARPMIHWGYGVRLMLPLMAVTAWASGWAGAGVGLVGVWAALAVLVASGGGVQLCWQELNSRVVLPQYRGRYVAVRLVLVTMAFVACGATTWALLGPLAAEAAGASIPPQDFAWPFGVGAIVYTAALPLLFRFREPIPAADPQPTLPYRRALARVLGVLRTDRRFVRFLAVRVATCAAWIFPMPLVAAYGRDGGFGVDVRQISLYFTAAFFLAQALMAPVGGMLADRLGHKVLHCVAMGTYCVAHLLTLSLRLWPAGWVFGGFLAALALQGAAGGWYFASQLNLVFEFADVHRRSSYIALSGLFIGPSILLFGLLGGAAAGRFGYEPTLWTALAAAGGAGALALWAMPDPRRQVHPPTLIRGDRP